MTREIGFRQSSTTPRAILLAALVLLLVGERASPQTNPLADDVADAIARYESGEFRAARRILNDVTEDRNFYGLDPSVRADAWYFLAAAHLEAGNNVRAHQNFRMNTSSSTGAGRDWLGRTLSAYRAYSLDDAIFSLTELANRSPATLHRNNTDEILSIVRTAWRPEEKSDAVLRLIGALAGSGWTSASPERSSRIYFEYALAEASQGRTVKAAEALAAVNSAPVVVRALIDSRFESVVSEHAELFDIDRAMSEELAAWDLFVQSEPADLAPILGFAEALRRDGKADTAIEVIDRALQAEHRWRDVDSYFQWLLTERSRSMWALGYVGVAIADLALVLENGGYAAQQNELAYRYALLGDSATALRNLPDVSRFSYWGLMDSLLTRVIVNFSDDDADSARKALSSMRNYADRAPRQMQKALIYAGEIEEATELYARRLADPDMRSDALLEAQTWLVTEVEQSPLQRRLAELERSFYSSADIRHQVEQYGTINSFNIRLTDKFYAEYFYY